jgi:hypothetical protein
MWRDEWLERVAAPCVALHPVAMLVASANANVSPEMPCVAEMWRTRACRELLVRSWSNRGLDVLLARDTVRVLVRARLVHDDDWVLVAPEYVELAVDETDYRTNVLAHVSVDVAALGDAGYNAAALSRNERLRPCDLACAVAWDPTVLAANPAVRPEALLAMRQQEGAAFYAALSTHPALTAAHVRSRPAAPWCWYTLSARCLGPEDTDLPLFPGALVLNPRFSDADLAALGLSRRPACAEHGYACAPRGRACGLKQSPVNWTVYARLTDDPARAVQETLDAGGDVEDACVAALGNEHCTLPLAAWCVARLGARLTRWAALTAIGNEMRHDRQAHKAARVFGRAAYASLVRVCIRRRLGFSLCRAIYGLMRTHPCKGPASSGDR